MLNDNVLLEQEKIIEERKTSLEETSYTRYLFESGLDKILKKVGEECTETIIAAKNLKSAPENADRTLLESELAGEVSDLLYHVQVMLADVGMSMRDVLAETDKRTQKSGNKKNFKKIDKNT